MQSAQRTECVVNCLFFFEVVTWLQKQFTGTLDKCSLGESDVQRCSLYAETPR
jgi:hypothetical protein